MRRQAIAGMGGGGRYPLVGDQHHFGPLICGDFHDLKHIVFIAADVKSQKHVTGRKVDQSGRPGAGSV